MDLSKIVVFLFLLLTSWVGAQDCSFFLKSEKNEAVTDLQIVLQQRLLFPSANGEFKAPCALTELKVIGPAEDTIIIKRSDNNTFVLSSAITALEEVKITKERLHYFDIGYLPPIKGTQIATGTSSIIETEGQGGAKSSANPRELFAKVPGLNIWESDGAGIQMGVGGRGLSPNRAANFNTRQNGYDISADALGYPESYYTPPLEALQSIEIIRGSASLQYGTQFGGLMNFVIKDPSSSVFEVTARNTVGNKGYIGSFTRVSGTKNRWSYQAYYQLKLGDGYRPNAQFTQHQGFAQLGYSINEKMNLRLEYTQMNYLAKQPGGLTDFQYEDDPYQSNRDRNWFKVDWRILALHYNYNISKKTLLNVRAFGMLSDRQSLGFLGKINQQDPGGNREMIDGTFKNAGVEARVLSRYSLGKKSNGAWLIGIRAYKGLTVSKQGTAPDGSDADFRFLKPNNLENSNYSFPSSNLAAFAENIFFFGNKLSANVGLRLDQIASGSSGYYKQYAIHPLTFDTLAINQLEGSNSIQRLVPLAGTGASYKLGKRTSLYANYCMNYRAVNFNDIRVVNPNVIIDTNMRDEYGATAELGWRGLLHRFVYVDIAAFHVLYGDKIGLAPEGVKKIRTNIGDAINQGVEVFAETDIIKLFADSSSFGLSYFVNFSYIDAHYVRSREPNYIGNQVEYVSPIVFRNGITFRSKRFQTQLQASYNAAQFSDASNAVTATADAVIGEIPAYWVVDFSARYQVGKFWQLETGVNNVLNSVYYTRRATAYPGPGILTSDGRTFYVTLQFKWNYK